MFFLKLKPITIKIKSLILVDKKQRTEKFRVNNGEGSSKNFNHNS